MIIDLNEDLLDDIANELGISEPSLVEKDFHVTQILAALSKFQSDDFKLIFAGGTCLSKTVNALGRMSEDIDFKLIPLDKNTDLSQGQLRTKLSKVKKHISKLISNGDYKGNIVVAENGNRHIEWEINYLPLLNPVDALRPIIQVETTYCQYFENHQIKRFGSMVAESMQYQLEVDSFSCVDATHTVAEKLLSLLRRIAGIARGLKWQDDRLVRHVYDIHILSHGDFINRTQFVTILEGVMKWDADRFKLQNPEFANNPIAECEIALDALKADDVYAKNYTDFLGPLVYAQDAETDFNVALSSVYDLFNYFINHQTKF